MTTYNPLNLLPLPATPTELKPVPTAITVDPFADLIWVGTSNGLVSAYCSPSHLTPNVRFPAHGANTTAFLPGSSSAVQDIRVTDRDVWTLTEGGVAGRRRGGLTRWTVSDPTRGMKCMAPNPVNSHEMLTGGMNGLTVINMSRSDVTRRVDTPSPTLYLAGAQRNVFAAHLSGQISLLDPRTGFHTAAKISPVQSHTGGLTGADAQGYMVCTWGWTHVSGHPLPDSAVRMYDIRTLRALPSVTFPAGPAFGVLCASDPANLVIAAQQGVMQSIDTSSGSAGVPHQLDVSSYVTSMALSPGGDYLAFGDAEGQLHLWTGHDTSEGARRAEDGTLALPPFNGYEGVKEEWPDHPDPLPVIDWTDQTPLNLIGMPHYTEPLLSNIPASDYAPASSPFFNPPEPIPPMVLSSVKMVDFIGYATVPPELRGRRYVRTARPGAGRLATDRGYIGRKESGPKFMSERTKRNKSTTSLEIEPETPIGEIPKSYLKVEIKYSKFGIEDFDFGFYNKTEYSGLETDILNSYTNALLQAFHYTLPLRSVAKAHICMDCKREQCLLCEAGFLFRMLEDAKGINCQASNFSRAFSAHPQASALGLTEGGENARQSYGSLIQSFSRWLLSTFSTEAIVGSADPVNVTATAPLPSDQTPSLVDQVLGISVRTTNTCERCHHVASRDSVIHAIDLAYPRKPENHLPFTDVLRSSILRETSRKATCANCKHFAVLNTQRTVVGQSDCGMPPVFTVNTMVSGPEIFELWRDTSEDGGATQYLPPEVAIARGQNGDLTVSTDGIGARYAVTSLVVQIQESPDVPAHLVSFARVPDEDQIPTWVMFNDFLVRQVSAEEVFRFPDAWKVPAVIVFQRQDVDDILDLQRLPTQLDPSILCEDVSVSSRRREDMIKHQPLEMSELPAPDTLISIDAEFVSLQQEELEFRSDGTKRILKPSHMSLARVSVLRGEGANEGLPFIDDYIHTSEVVVDYLTEFSGIQNGDLDPSTSTHTLVPLKVAYKKLRLLVDLGCIFIGHGLSKDFRTINIFVPAEQVMDTVKLFTVPGRQRKLSLRFLTWFLLKTDIQTLTHDSIEDAKYALLLYKAYLGFEKDGRLEEVMEDIFEAGSRLGFRPPPPLPDVAIVDSRPTSTLSSSEGRSTPDRPPRHASDRGSGGRRRGRGGDQPLTGPRRR